MRSPCLMSRIMQSTRRWRVWTSRVGIETPRFRHAASKIRRALPRFRSSTLRASSSDTTPGLRLSLSVLRSVNARQPKWFLRRMQGNRTRARDRSETEFDWHSPVLALNCCVAARLRDRTLEHSEGRWGLEGEDQSGGMGWSSLSHEKGAGRGETNARHGASRRGAHPRGKGGCWPL